MKKFSSWHRPQFAGTSREAAPSVTTAPLEPGDTATNPLARLGGYELRHLVSHLAASERANELRRLLFLRTGSDGNAWFAAAPDVRAYLSDLAHGQELATRQGDCSAAVVYRLIGNSVQAMASVPGSLLEALVKRGLLPVDDALAMAQSAQAPDQRITASAAVLSQLDRPQQLDLVGRLVDEMAMRSVNLSTIGELCTEPRLPLTPRQHMEVIRRLTAVPELPDALLERLAGVATMTTSSYVQVEALTEVAGVLPADRRQSTLAQAWALADSQDDFRGRPEGQALVAATYGGQGRADRDYAAEALKTTLRVLSAWPERINFHDWVPYADNPTFGCSPMMRLESFAQPLRRLCPCLADDELAEVIRELTAREDAQSQVATITVLPEVAARGRVAEAFQLASALQAGALWARAALLGAGHAPQPQDNPADILGEVVSIPDPEQRVLALLALMPALGASARYHILTGMLAGVEDLPSGSSFRSDVIDRLPTLIRGLPQELRNDLIALAADPGKLTRTAKEADALLSPLTSLWPDSLLRRRLAESRSVALDSGITARLRRRVEAGPVGQGSVGALILPAGVVTAALDHARGLADTDKAATVLFLLPFLDHAARDAAADVIAGISAPHLRLLPIVQLLAGQDAPSADSLVAAVELLGKVHGSLRRLQSSIDTVAKLVRSRGPSQVAVPCCRLIRARDNQDVAAVLPLARAASGTDLSTAVEETISALAHWFGPASPARDAPEDTGHDIPPPRLDIAAAAVALVRQLSLARDWTGVGHLLSAIRATAGLGDAAMDQAETYILDVPEPHGTSGGAEHRALVEQIVRDAPTTARRLKALAWLLAEAADRADTGEVTKWSAHPDLVLDPRSAGDPELIAVAAAAIKGLLATGQRRRAAEALNVLMRPASATTATSLLIADAARSLQMAVDSRHGQDEAGEQALGLFLDFVSSQPANYLLQESAGALLRNRVAMALSAGRPVRPAWLARLEALADADDAGEVLLEGLAVGARCDAARSAIANGDGSAAAHHLRAAFSRWRRHRVVGATAHDFVAAGRAVLSGGDGVVDAQDADEVACLGAIVCVAGGSEVPQALAERLCGPADVRGALARLGRSAGLSESDEHDLEGWLAGLASPSLLAPRGLARPGGPRQDVTFGSFGKTPDEIPRTEFYKFFHLAESSRSRAASGEVIIRYQNKYQYRHLCGLECTSDTAGNIIRLSLDIAAQFIEQADIAPFARDFARSFIEDAVATPEDRDVLRPIIVDLQRRPIPGTARMSHSTLGGPEKILEGMIGAIDLGRAVAVNMGGRARDVGLAEIPSRGFAVYQGERSAFTATLSATTFTMQNGTAGNNRKLTISFEPRYSANLGAPPVGEVRSGSCRTAKGEDDSARL